MLPRHSLYSSHKKELDRFLHICQNGSMEDGSSRDSSDSKAAGGWESWLSQHSVVLAQAEEGLVPGRRWGARTPGAKL